MTVRGAALRGQFQRNLATRGKGFDGNPALTFQLEREGDHLRGVCSASVPKVPTFAFRSRWIIK